MLVMLSCNHMAVL